ncbi:MAG: hypothetical protein V1761_02145 [bacterium]
MKKLLLLGAFLTCLFLTQSFDLRADTISYPFDSIRIVSAYRFDIEIATAPDPTSILYAGSEVDDILTVYVGALEYMNDGEIVSGSDSILIITDAEDETLVAFLINSFSTDLLTYAQYSYASWITINPEVGVIKDFTVALFELTVYHDLTLGTYKLIDNATSEFSMVSGSYLEEPVLDILISAFVEEE